jgi:hypothetical protein
MSIITSRISGEHRRQGAKDCSGGCPGRVCGEDDCPQPSQLRQIRYREIGCEGQYGSNGVFRKQLLACQDDDQKADRVSMACEQRPS